ncbi:ATP-dependent exoDNAse (exonuclease V), alpha subunit, helicase superfamily I [Pontibacter lucknowensis]|uniref:ATP-dependent exoDNAse (Exonuclease V), alpha subunit, helicase superfamily I n=2 Tax=Pontibacter lucknowensis TaxID=1077936 RepID=A0A1N6TIV8_9BACT|nr:ATP-dependent exoDNAse (exonuclease V), alpha subunit, helicase superfamily I [Pontibacter lucknowensis]
MRNNRKHISARLTWHNDGWNGKVCQDPEANVHCTGQFSYPGGMYEKKHLQATQCVKYAGGGCSSIHNNYIPPCSFSINAFGKETIKAETTSPEWYKNAEVRQWDMPPSTISIWPYEEMYNEGDKNDDGTFNYDKRISNVKAFINQVKEESSLIFYYSNYSNPLSQDDAKNYVIVGLSRVKKVGEFMEYEKATAEERKRYAGAFVWQIPITSNYPEEGFRIPYHRYKDNEEALRKIAFFPENDRNFKYAMRHITDDDALEIVERALEIVDVLENELKDDSEDWSLRRIWLQSLLAELWHNRGRYPGLPHVLNYLKLPELIKYFKEQTAIDKEEEAYQQIKSLLLDYEDIEGVTLDQIQLGNASDLLASKEEAEIELLFDILPRFELTEDQIGKILSENRAQNGLYCSLEELVKNPYLLSESYVGDDPDDKISFSKIDHGMLPPPDMGLKQLTTAGSPIRFRALCVNQLKGIGSHTFSAAEIILDKVNKHVTFLSDWRKFEFTLRNFKSYAAELDQAIYRREDANGNLYLYLNQVFADERFIEARIREMAQQEIGNIKSPVTEKNWFDYLYDAKSELAKQNPAVYQEAVKGQAEVCEKIFNKGLSIISGGAGTGKTTIIKSIIKGIEKAHGQGTSFLLLAPTGKAADRLRERTQKPAKTIHSFLSGLNWLNNNFTLKPEGGRQEENTRIFIIDECSMIDQTLMATLFRAINWNTVQRIILVGDPNQLPPIGIGKVFSDVLNWLDDANKGELKVNLRQMENKLLGRGTGILDLASSFIQSQQISAVDGEVDENELSDLAEQKAVTVDLLKHIQELDFTGDLKDLNVKFWENEKELKNIMFQTLVEDLEAEYDLTYDEVHYWELLNKAFEHPDNADDRKADKFQVISPYRSEVFGTESLNVFLQSKFNKIKVENRQFLDGISLFDKVIQYRNRTKSDPIFAYLPKTKTTEKIQIFNGELGFTRPHGFDKGKTGWSNFRVQRFVVNLESRDAHIPMGKEIGNYVTEKGYKRNLPEEKPVNNLELAYAISVHKSQGSEFNWVYLVLPKNKKALLSKELIYTAITRAKTKLTIFAEQDIGAFLQLTRPEANSLSRINSSLFEFKPLPKEWLVMNDWYEEGKIHATLSQYMVRSKSEVIIANMLTERNIPFRYEKPLFAPDGSFYLPDFTVMVRGEEYYLEHVGRLDLPKYKAHWEEKERWYNKHFPGKLLTTYEGGTLSNDINKIIKALS